MRTKPDSNVYLLRSGSASSLPLPFYSSKVPAGFPPPAEDHLGDTLDLSTLLIKHPAATFFVRVSGDSLTGLGILDDDILVVDRSLEARNNQLVVAVVDGEMTAKVLELGKKGVRLLPANPDYAPIVLADGQELNIWDLVTGLVRPNMARGNGVCAS